MDKFLLYHTSLTSKSPFLLNKNIKFNKNETEWNTVLETDTVLEKWAICFNWYKNCELKVKLSRVGAHERKKNAPFVRFILSERNFLNILVLSQCIVYWMHFQNIDTFTYQKT